jgi:GNAT superfamily N-acetyltransferase
MRSVADYSKNGTPGVSIERVQDVAEKRRIAEHILLALPDWFGIPEYTQRYIEESSDLPFWVARRGQDPVGFITLKETSPYTAEIHVMGVLPQYHRKGIGRRLFSALYDFCKQEGYEFLQVKTVDEGKYEQYDRTRLFYESVGFRKLEVFPALWDERNPCLVMVMAVR